MYTLKAKMKGERSGHITVALATLFLTTLFLFWHSQRNTFGDATPFSVGAADLRQVAETGRNLQKLYKRLLPSLPIKMDGRVIAHVHEDPTHQHAPWVNAFWGQVNNGTWEPETLDVYKSCISPETSVIDFGSWIGPTVAWAVGLGAKGVYSFEPDPLAFAELSLNARLSGWENVHIHHACIAPQEGVMPVFLRGQEGTSGSSVYEASHRDVPAYNVSCYKLDSVVRHYKLTSSQLFLKMDVEGYEKDLLPTLSRLFASYKPVLYLSLHGAVTTFTYQQWQDMAQAVSVFPLAYKHTPGTGWKQVNSLEVLQAMRRDGRSNHEMLFSWPDRCPSLVK